MRVITAFFGWYAPDVLPPACVSFLPRLQEVRTIDKTRNQFPKRMKRARHSSLTERGLLAVGPDVAPAHHRLAPGCIVADTASIGQSHGLFHRLLTLSSTPHHLQCPQRAGAAAAGPG